MFLRFRAVGFLGFEFLEFRVLGFLGDWGFGVFGV